MKKRLFPAIITVLMLAALCLTVYGSPSDGMNGAATRVNDFADLFLPEEEEALLTYFDEISETLQFDVVVVTTDSLDGKSCMAYADDFFDYNGFGYGENYDGALFLISVEPDHRQCWISTSGFGIKAIDDDTVDEMLDTIVGYYLSDGEYAYGAAEFAYLCGQAVDGAREAATFSTGKLIRWVGIGLVIGVVVALIYVAILKSQMKSVHLKGEANDYVKKDSLHLTDKADIFLYRSVSRVKHESSGGSSSHTSSSGRSHGGGGRSF